MAIDDQNQDDLTISRGASSVNAPGLGKHRRIGPWRLLELLGEGGMGAVYLAEQDEPVYRRVALKVIKPGMDSREVLARFDSERQALARLNHPGIATIFEAGSTDDGRPYFVMELVRGLPITEYCNTNKLAIRERLELFVQVCRAMHHAHQKGIIHRDLKPSNVLVGLVDGVPAVKVIDFGLAKAIDQRLTERTLFTQHGMLVGTPEYMSPEQAGKTNLDVDITTDVYSLGILLYELLVGVLYFRSWGEIFQFNQLAIEQRNGTVQYALRSIDIDTEAKLKIRLGHALRQHALAASLVDG